MPRSNRPRGRKAAPHDERDLAASILGGRHTQSKRDGDWIVQPISAASATKSYTCPGCSVPVAPGIAHVVTWRADAMLGDDHALADRRHWHSHCWKIK